MAERDGIIEVLGARVHNLKNVDVTLPRNKLVVITGLSGSGKSSLAFDTIYAEGQRRYIETFSAYARQFLGGLERPDVDKINGLSPVISIEQKTTNKNPRSTVGTITEIYDFLRLLYARSADAFSYVTGEQMVQYTLDQIVELLREKYANQRIYILSPLVRQRKGIYQELFQQVARQGFLKVRVDGEITGITPGMKLNRYQTHDIEAVIDRLTVPEESGDRLKKSVERGLQMGKGIVMIVDEATHTPRFFSQKLMCPTSGISYEIPEPNFFSFNSPKGACPTCNGLGRVPQVHMDKIIPERNKSIAKGGLAPLGEQKNSWIFKEMKIIAERFGFSLSDPIADIPTEALDAILHGIDETFELDQKSIGVKRNYHLQFDGLVPYIQEQYEQTKSMGIRHWASKFIVHQSCSDCEGMRLHKEALHFRINGKNIAELSTMDISELVQWMARVDAHLSPKQLQIAGEILKEIRVRLNFLTEVGLGYLALNRTSRSLSGGEAQRIRLATQIGSQLVNVLYILDEPSIGLHQRDNERLIHALEHLRDLGNSILVVEHDRDMIEAADYVIDMGPGAGVHGGEVVSAGAPQELFKADTVTGRYLSQRDQIKIPTERRVGNGNMLKIIGAHGHNLKSVDLELPLGMMVGITGVSGSGKSSLINETLYPILNAHFFNSNKRPLPYERIEGLEHLDKIIEIDQSPIGRTPRSNPSTYTGVFSEIRTLFTQLPEAKIRGYKPGRFSFNVKGGRCETCQGAGLQVIEMNFLPDVHVPCPECGGKRFNRETLEVRYKGKSISDVLEMSVDDAVPFFDALPRIARKIKTLQDVGLGYLTLGQQSTTLSGGEAQRVKLATELSKKDTGNTLYILDEPTTGLHFEDIRILLEVLQKLVNRGNTVVIIEHNLDVIKVMDYLIDLGPEGGRGGGQIIATGTPEEVVANHPESATAKYLALELNRTHEKHP